MKTSFFYRLAQLLGAGVLALLASCGERYESRSYVYGTAQGLYSEPIPAHVTVVDADGNAITSGYANRNSVYYGRRYYGNRYYGGMYYGYNNTPVYPLPGDARHYDSLAGRPVYGSAYGY